MIHFKIYNTVNEIPNEWDALPVNDVFLKTPFLKALEQALPSNISSYFVAVYKNNTLVGIAIIQRVQMYLDDVFRDTSNTFIKQVGKGLVSKFVRGNGLVVGNLMHTGQHGIWYNYEVISLKAFLNTIKNAISQLSVYIKKTFNKKVRIIVFKDYFEDDKINNNTTFFKSQNLYKVQLQPNMLFHVNTAWANTNDYVAAFNKKYKRRYTTARKKSAQLVCKELSLDFIKANTETIYKLYKQVSDNARVNSFKLPKNHFLSLKTHLKQDFKMFGYFLNNELIGFYSLVLNNTILETYFLGYNKHLQQKHQLYLNMLFNMACYGIDNSFKTIVYARTAMEIKSSIGAKPHTMHVYLKHTNHLIVNTVLKCVVKYMNPIRTWEERHPFK